MTFNVIVLHCTVNLSCNLFLLFEFKHVLEEILNRLIYISNAMTVGRKVLIVFINTTLNA